MLEKITREQIATFLDVTPSGEHTFEKIGIGITSMGQEYNPQKTTEKWIINKNATTSTELWSILPFLRSVAFLWILYSEKLFLYL